MKSQISCILFAASIGAMGAQAETDCIALSQSVSLTASKDKSAVLEIVSREIAASPGCACEIVKAAIKSTEAEAALVAAIVEAAITTAPEHMRLISQCAIAVAPDAIAEIQAVLAKLDQNSGESAGGSKSAKDAKAGVASETPPEEPWNPLDPPWPDKPGPPEKTNDPTPDPINPPVSYPNQPTNQ